MLILLNTVVPHLGAYTLQQSFIAEVYMVRVFVLLALSLSLAGCYKDVHGYKVNMTWGSYHNLWEYPVNLDSDEEQVIDVPFIKYGSYFSLCFDKAWSNPEALPDSEYYLTQDSLDVSFYIGDTVIVGDRSFASFPEFNCPINGRYLMGIYVPEGFDREKGGQLRFRMRKRHYLKNIPNARVVLAWGGGAK